ncbi:amidohydrolase family protein, partial [Streptomyces sp. MBT97]|nr:amidohydrolase family protein [Streptomyces sp. MBT97]
PGVTLPVVSSRWFTYALPAVYAARAVARSSRWAGSAYVNHLDDTTGSVTPGKSADLVVLDRDPFAGPPAEIAASRVVQTFVDGARVYAADDA